MSYYYYTNKLINKINIIPETDKMVSKSDHVKNVSLIVRHVNDAAFWMFKEYFGLTIKETFLTWSLLETILSVSGIIFILFISLFV